MTWNESCLYDFEILKRTREARKLFLDSMSLAQNGEQDQAVVLFRRGEHVYQQACRLASYELWNKNSQDFHQSGNSIRQTRMAYEMAAPLVSCSKRNFQELRRYSAR